MSVESQTARKDDNVGAEMEDPDEVDRGTTPCEGYLFLKEDFSSVSSTSDLNTDYLPQVCMTSMNKHFISPIFDEKKMKQRCCIYK